MYAQISAGPLWATRAQAAEVVACLAVPSMSDSLLSISLLFAAENSYSPQGGHHRGIGRAI